MTKQKALKQINNRIDLFIITGKDKTHKTEYKRLIKLHKTLIN